MLNYCSTNVKLPSVRKMQRSLRPRAMAGLFARSHVKCFNVDREKAGSSLGVGRYKNDSASPVRIVRPSEWARMDFSTRETRELVWGIADPSGATEPLFRSIEESAIIRNREECLSPFTVPDEFGYPRLLRRGQMLHIVCIRSGDSTNDIVTVMEDCGVPCRHYS